MTEQEIKNKLRAKGCLYSSDLGHHFIGISGSHLNGYCNVDPALPDVAFIAELARQLVKPFAGDDVDTVLAPAIGAIPLAQWGPYHLTKLTGKTVLGVWADKVKPRGFVIERNGFAEAVAGKRVLILEDMVNRMFSVKELIHLTGTLGGTVVGVGAMVANSIATAEKMGTSKFVRLCDFSYETWEPDDCPLCANHVPIVTDRALGHGYEFQQDHPGYEGGYAQIQADHPAVLRP